MGKVCPPESATGYKQPPQQEKGFAASTAAVSGESKRAINQHLARADALGDDLERITGTSITPARVEGTTVSRPATLPVLMAELLAALVQKPCTGGYMVATWAGKRKTPLPFE